MKRYEVRMLARARREYAAATAWWRLNRRAAPNMLLNEMLAVRELLAKFPETGEVDEGQGGEVGASCCAGRATSSSIA